MRSPPFALAALLALLAIGAAPRAAHAQPAGGTGGAAGTSRADQLFEQGRALMAAHDYAAACPKFEESQRLDPALGTLLNLALCEEQVGHLARALARWRDALAQAQASGESKRAATAQEHVTALDARVPSVTITVKGAPADGIAVTVDGVVLPPAQLGQPLRIDPGAHAIHADAAGYQGVDEPVTLHEGDRDVLVELTLSAAVAPAHASRRPLAYGLGGGGLVAIAGAAVLGLTAKSKYDRAFSDGHCDRTTLACDDVGQAATDSARSRGTLATVIGAVGLAAVAAGAYVYLTSPSERDAPRTAIVPTGTGLAVVGTF